MTCEEFHQLNSGSWEDFIANTTRAQRALACRHINNCMECYKWIFSARVTDTKVYEKGGDQLFEEDSLDPEFYDVAFRKGE